MKYYPFNYHEINVAAGYNTPSTIKAVNNRSFWYWSRSLFQRAVSVIDFTVPDTWEGATKDFFHYCLFQFGFVAVFDSAEMGLAFQPYTLSGYNFYYQPTRALIANPLYNEDLRIGEECEILKLTPDYYGIFDIVEYYAEKLSLLDNAINASLINSKLSYILGGKTKSAVQALKKIFDKINAGEPAVFMDSTILDTPKDKDTPFQFLSTGDLNKNYLTTDQLADLQTILHNFDAEIGIPSLPYNKKERLVASEATMRTKDSQARALVWLETLNSSIERVKMLYPYIALSAKLHYDEDADGLPDVGEVEGNE